MRIGLFDADNTPRKSIKRIFPNLCLMKLSTYRKAIGDDVEIALPIQLYDRVYISKAFDLKEEPNHVWRCDDVIRGGTTLTDFAGRRWRKVAVTA